MRRPRSLLLAFAFGLCVLGASGRAHAQASDGFGLGLILGDPTGVSAKGFVSETNAIDGAIGFGVLGGDSLHIHADYLWHFDIKRWASAGLDLHLGVGPKLGFRDKKRDSDVLIGARGPIGLTVRFTEAPFDVFVEVAAGLWIVEKVGFDVDAAIGGRYWF